MKKGIFTIVFLITTMSVFSQNASIEKTIITAPDDSVALTVYNNTAGNDIKVESVDSFYKYQLLDAATSKPVLTANNKGKACVINRKNVAAGNYKLKIYTKDFVITSKITLLATNKLRSDLKEETALASNEFED